MGDDVQIDAPAAKTLRLQHLYSVMLRYGLDIGFSRLRPPRQDAEKHAGVGLEPAR